MNTAKSKKHGSTEKSKKGRRGTAGSSGGKYELKIHERERRIFTATQLLGDTLAGTAIGHGLGWISLLSSLGITGYEIYVMEDVALERRGFLGMGLVFITSSVVTMAKTLRDSAEAGKLEMLQREVAQVCNEMAAPLPRSSLDKEMRGAVESLRGGGYWYFQSIAMLAGSVGMTLYGLFQMPIKPEQRRFTALGIGFVMSSCFFVFNQARDSREVSCRQVTYASEKFAVFFPAAELNFESNSDRIFLKAKKWLNMLADDIADLQEPNDSTTQASGSTPMSSINV